MSLDDKFDNSFLLTPSITCHKQNCQKAGGVLHLVRRGY